MKKMKDRLIHLCRIMGKYISLAINWKRPEKTVKDILLFANTSTMEEYLKNYLDAVGDNPDYRFYIFLERAIQTGEVRCWKEHSWKEKASK